MTHAPHSVGLLWTSDRPVPESSTWQTTPLTKYRHPCLWWNSKSQSQQASDHRDNFATTNGLQAYNASICLGECWAYCERISLESFGQKSWGSVREAWTQDYVCFPASKSPALVGHACKLAACLMRVNAHPCGIHADKAATQLHKRKHTAVNTSIVTCCVM